MIYARHILVLAVLLVPGVRLLHAQHISKNNYTGKWESPSSWSPAWQTPQYDISGFDITISGYITASSSLSFSGSANNLTINDTLVIEGNLTISNNTQVSVGENGILIVRGNLIMNNQTGIKANGYLVITGGFTKTSALTQGFFASNDNPVKVFIGGTINPPELLANVSGFAVLDCTSKLTAKYRHSLCSYGNIDDLKEDPVYSFFITTCKSVTAGSNSPVCSGNPLNLTASNGLDYAWTGPSGFSSTRQNPVVENPVEGTYSVTSTTSTGCISTARVMVTVNQSPVVSITNPEAVCAPATVDLTSPSITAGSTSGLAFTYWTNAGATVACPAPRAATAGTYYIKGTTSSGCFGIKPVKVTVNPAPVADAGPDQELKYVFRTVMNASTVQLQTGEWSLVSGSGQFSDIHSPSAVVTGLSLGENIFKWTVKSGGCEARDDVIIRVLDIQVPSAISPNSDGKNDFFRISGTGEKIELIILNRWGATEYHADDYRNDWDGRNNKGSELPDDTYMYIVRLPGGAAKKGTVLILR